MGITDFNKKKKLDVESVSGTPTISRTVCLKITNGDDSTTGTGEIVLDWSNISSKADIGVYDENDNLLDYYFESFDDTEETAVIWVYRDWVRDGSTQLQVAYGDGSSDESVSSSTVFDKESDLAGGWLLNETSGDALDVTSNNNDGTVNGATQGVDGQVGGAYEFDGEDDYVDMPGLQTFSGYTASLWLKLDQIQSNWNIVFDTWEDAGGDHQASIESGSEGNSTLTVKTPDGTVDLADFSNYTGDWTHITVTYDGSQWVTYVNGSQQNSLDGTSDPDLSGGFRLMGRDGSSDYEVDGMSDDVHIHTSALSSDEIIATYDATKSSPDFFSQQAGEDTQEINNLVMDSQLNRKIIIGGNAQNKVTI